MVDEALQHRGAQQQSLHHHGSPVCGPAGFTHMHSVVRVRARPDHQHSGAFLTGLAITEMGVGY
jgi:hypothetical protein